MSEDEKFIDIEESSNQFKLGNKKIIVYSSIIKLS